MTAPLRTLPAATLDAQLADLQRRAFVIYEDVAARVEADPDLADSAYAAAEREAGPLIAEARLLNDERVRRLRARATRWRILTFVVAGAGFAVIAWRLFGGFVFG